MLGTALGFSVASADVERTAAKKKQLKRDYFQSLPVDNLWVSSYFGRRTRNGKEEFHAGLDMYDAKKDNGVVRSVVNGRVVGVISQNDLKNHNKVDRMFAEDLLKSKGNEQFKKLYKSLYNAFYKKNPEITKGKWVKKKNGQSYYTGDKIKSTGFGNLVIVRENFKDGEEPRYVLYGHLKTFNRGLRVGNIVKAGDVLGLIGNTGNSGGAHLHLGVFRYMNGNKEFLNPANYIKIKYKKNKQKEISSQKSGYQYGPLSEIGIDYMRKDLWQYLLYDQKSGQLMGQAKANKRIPSVSVDATCPLPPPDQPILGKLTDIPGEMWRTMLPFNFISDSPEEPASLEEADIQVPIKVDENEMVQDESYGDHTPEELKQMMTHGLEAPEELKATDTEEELS